MDLKIYLIILLSIIFLISGIGQIYQNKPNRIGGKIAPSKNIWLMYTINTWFFAPIFIVYFSKTALYFPLIFLSSSMWIRGIIELYLLFVTKNWKPKYGIIHDLFTFITLIVVSIYQSNFQIYEIIFLISLHVSLILETYYAYFFSKFVGIKTQGDEGIWFANKDDPIFKRILKITTIGNIYVIFSYLYFLFKLN